MRAIESERCTALKGSTVIFLDLINHPDLRKHDLTSLQHILFGGAVVPKDIILKIKNTLNLKSAHIAWGMTEITSSGTCTVDGDLLKSEAHAFETIGTAMPYTETKIVDPKTGELVERNKDGEICIRSYGVIKGYWEDPEKTAEIIDKNGLL
jgi:fatty-acyl-CoA synthase